jgi:hypothetical protein
LAKDYFSKALTLDERNPEYIRDYAMALFAVQHHFPDQKLTEYIAHNTKPEEISAESSAEELFRKNYLEKVTKPDLEDALKTRLENVKRGPQYEHRPYPQPHQWSLKEETSADLFRPRNTSIIPSGAGVIGVGGLSRSVTELQGTPVVSPVNPRTFPDRTNFG